MNRDLVGLTLASIKACCESLERHIEDIDPAAKADLDKYYRDILAVQARIVLGMTPEQIARELAEPTEEIKP